MNRLVIVPDEKHEALGQELKLRLAMTAGKIHAENIAGFIGRDEFNVLSRCVQSTGAHELLLWARSERGYGVAWTSLIPVEEMVGAASADAEEGLVQAIFESGHTETQAADELQAEAWSNIEKRRGRRVASMVGGPVLAAGKCVAALTLVQYGDAGEDELGHDDAVVLSAAGSLLGRLLEDHLIRATLGLNL